MTWGRAKAAIVLAATAAIAACVLVEPPQELPVPALRRPLILQTSLQPPKDQPITDLDNLGTFVAFVDAEPSKSFDYRVWVDFGSGDQPIDGRTVPPDPAGSGKREVDFSVQSSQVGDSRFCHTITFVVAYSFIPVSNTPADEGDQVTWYYRPNGNGGGCIALDGGIPDAGALDASDGGGE
jgi:hypothetical protein